MKNFKKALGVFLLSLLIGNVFAMTLLPSKEHKVKIRTTKSKSRFLSTLTISNHSTKSPYFFWSGPVSGSGGAYAVPTVYNITGGTYTLLVVGLDNDTTSVRVTVNGVSQVSTGADLTFTSVSTPITVGLVPN